MGWAPLHAPGGRSDHNMVDWYKAKPSPVSYVQQELGIGMEIQFGNNYQLNEDIKRLSEAFLSGKIQSGVILVASDILAQHKADRGAFFSDAKSKLERHYSTLYASQARRIPPIMIIAIQHDGYNEEQTGRFEITPVKYSREDGQLKAEQCEVMTNI